MEFASRLPPRTALALAAISYVVLHVISVQALPSNQAGTMLSAVQQSLIYTLATFLQYIVPFCLSAGVLGSVLRRRRADRLLAAARDNPPSTLSSISWRDFERLVGGAFRQKGYSVTEVGGNGPDGGIDLILTRNGRRYLVQCKRWKTWHIGVSVVRELKAVVAAEGAAGGFVVTGGHFTRDAWESARKTGIELIDGEALEKLIGPVKVMPAAPATEAEAVEESAPACPKCGGDMIQREAARGQVVGQALWGCRGYPKCKGIVPMLESNATR
jgi:restriction system protein